MKVKPIVIGYKQIEWLCMPMHGLATETKAGMIEIAGREFKMTGIKSKFRPVYDGNEVVDD